jgi:hypothetical protein
MLRRVSNTACDGVWLKFRLQHISRHFRTSQFVYICFSDSSHFTFPSIEILALNFLPILFIFLVIFFFSFRSYFLPYFFLFLPFSLLLPLVLDTATYVFLSLCFVLASLIIFNVHYTFYLEGLQALCISIAELRGQISEDESARHSVYMEEVTYIQGLSRKPEDIRPFWRLRR